MHFSRIPTQCQGPFLSSFPSHIPLPRLPTSPNHCFSLPLAPFSPLARPSPAPAPAVAPFPSFPCSLLPSPLPKDTYTSQQFAEAFASNRVEAPMIYVPKQSPPKPNHPEPNFPGDGLPSPYPSRWSRLENVNAGLEAGMLRTKLNLFLALQLYPRKHNLTKPLIVLIVLGSRLIPRKTNRNTQSSKTPVFYLFRNFASTPPAGHCRASLPLLK